MAVLKDILYKVSLKSVSGDTGIEVDHIVFDSRKVVKGCVFVAVKGTQTDGHQYIDKAVDQGALAIVCQQLPANLEEGITYVEVDNSARALGILASNFYGNPGQQLKLVAVTGTNGKTTTVTLLFKLFRQLGYNCGLLSTVENRINEKILPATHTTPDPVQINQLMAQMAKEGCTHAFMEASSHAIDQERIAGLDFKVAVFTNITHDHLDYHGTFQNYIEAKKKLFDQLPAGAVALVNSDDRRSSVMLQNTRAAKKTYGLKSYSDFKGKVISNTLNGLEMEVGPHIAWFKLIGDFNAYNIMAVYATAILLDEKEEDVLTELSNLTPATGRFDRITHASGVTAIVDYAHTPDALENVLKTIDSIRSGNEKVITVVGCGGNRDKQKRPLMAKIAAQFSDQVILTSDNPRDEEPQDIINQMEEGVPITDQKKTISMVDRREAIKLACKLASGPDIILVAGKGHETYQEIRGIKHPFDDRQIVKEMMDLILK